MPKNSKQSFRAVDEGKISQNMFFFMIVASNLDSKLSPRGTQLIIIGTPCPKEPNIDYQPWINRLKEVVIKTFPNIFEKATLVEVTTPKDIANWKGRFSGGAIGLAQTPYCTGKNRPSNISPIEGLY